jgi:hypothetical protein
MAKKVSQPNARLNAFEENLANYFGFSKGENLKKDTSFFIDEFFNGYEVEIWLCDNRLEMHALEDLITLYTNRMDNDKGYDLRKNNFFNPIVGSLFESLAMIEAYNLEKLESLVLESFDRALPREMVYNRFLKEGIKISESTFDSYCEKLTGTTYYNAMNKYIILKASISSNLDARTRSWLSKKFSKEKLNTLLWTAKGPDGSLKPLFLGSHLSADSENGFLHSFLKHRSKFAKWFIRDNRQPLPTCRMVSEVVYNAIKYNDFSSWGNNRFKYNFIYKLKPISFNIEFNSKTGEIEKIEPQK